MRPLATCGLMAVLLLGSTSAQAAVHLGTGITYRSARARGARDWVARRHRRRHRHRSRAAHTAARQKATAATPAKATPNLPPPPPLPTGYRAVALLPLQGYEVDDALLESVQEALLSEVDETAGMRAISPTDVMNDLSHVGLDPSQCDGETACLARCGRYARAHMAIATKVAALGGTINISLILIDTQKAAEIGRVANPISEVRNERAQQLHRLAVQLLTPDSYVGTLIIKTKVAGADVYIDDKLVGTTPLKPLSGLRAGPHILRITKPGFGDLNRFVDVVYKRTSTLNVDLSNTTISGVIVKEVSRTGFGSLYVLCKTPGIEIRVDGEPKDSTVLKAPIEKVAAGKRRISFWKGGQSTQVDDVKIEAGKRTDLALNVGPDGKMAVSRLSVVEAAAPLPQGALLAATDATAPGPPAAQLRGTTWLLSFGIVVAGLGGCGLVVSSLYANQVVQERKARDALLAGASGGLTQKEYDAQNAKLASINNRGSKAQRNQFIFLGVGAGLAVVGGALAIWDLVESGTPVEHATTHTGVAGAAHVGLQPLVGGGIVSVGGHW